MDQYELDYLIGDSPISPAAKERLLVAVSEIENVVPETARNLAVRTAVAIALGDSETKDLAEAWRVAQEYERKAYYALHGALAFDNTAGENAMNRLQHTTHSTEAT